MAIFGNLAHIISYAIFLILLAPAAFSEARDEKYECLDGIGGVLDGISSTSGVYFCEEFRSGWAFNILPFGGHFSVGGDGTISQIFNMRQPSWQAGHQNKLEFNFVIRNPDAPNLYSINIIIKNSKYDRDEIYKDTGTSKLYFWGRNPRPSSDLGPYGTKWNPTRLISCLIATGRCTARYDVITCRKYKFPNFPDREVGRRGGFDAPVIFVSATGSEASEDLLDNFELAHGLIEEALNRLLEHSCN